MRCEPRVKPSRLFLISKMQAQIFLSMPQAEEAIRAEKYPNLVSPRRLKALVVRPFSSPLHVLSKIIEKRTQERPSQRFCSPAWTRLHDDLHCKCSNW